MKRIVSITAGTVAGILLFAALFTGCSTKTRVSFGMIDETGARANGDAREEAPVKYTDNSLLGRWSFDHADLGRNTANDRLNAKINKKPATVAGVVGKAIELSPNKKTVIEVAPEILPEIGLTELSFVAWIAPNSIANNSVIIGKDAAQDYMGTRRMSLTLREGQYLAFGINCGGNYAECNAPVSRAELCDGRWHLAGGTFDGKRMHVYLDGREIASFGRQTGIRTALEYGNNSPLFIGSLDGKSEFFDGRID